jgi:hypothetical protein
MKTIASLLLVTLLGFGCVELHGHYPFSHVNTIVVAAGKTNAPLGSAKAVVIAYRQTPGRAEGLAQPKTPKVFVVNYDELRGVKFVDRGVRIGSHAVGDIYSREKILVYRSGFEPAWLEKKPIGKQFKYPTILALIPCDPVRGRRLVFDAVSNVFREEPETVRQAILKKLARSLE